jgi:hypothetical protein
MSTPRTKCVSTKLTDEEFSALERAAGAQTLSTWMRDALLRAASSPTASEVIVLAEVLALRTILLNAHYATANGDVLTAERMGDLIARADQNKRERARQCLASTASQPAL